jgi:hypothetical protein
MKSPKQLNHLGIIVLTCLTASAVKTPAALTSTYTDMGNLSATVTSVTTNLTVSAGDVVVMIGASNKKASASLITFTSTAGSFINLDANTLLGTDPTPNAYLSYLPITTGGTFDFTGTSSISTQTGNLGIYTLSAGSGVIQLGDSNAKKYSGLAIGASESITNFLSWGVDPSFGDVAVIGVASSLRGNISTASLTLDENNASKRLAGITILSSGANHKAIWDVTNADLASTESGGITGAAFVEIVPEPSVLALAAAGMLGISVWRRRS